MDLSRCSTTSIKESESMPSINEVSERLVTLIESGLMNIGRLFKKAVGSLLIQIESGQDSTMEISDARAQVVLEKKIVCRTFFSTIPHIFNLTVYKQGLLDRPNEVFIVQLIRDVLEHAKMWVCERNSALTSVRGALFPQTIQLVEELVGEEKVIKQSDLRERITALSKGIDLTELQQKVEEYRAKIVALDCVLLATEVNREKTLPLLGLEQKVQLVQSAIGCYQSWIKGIAAITQTDSITNRSSLPERWKESIREYIAVAPDLCDLESNKSFSAADLQKISTIFSVAAAKELELRSVDDVVLLLQYNMMEKNMRCFEKVRTFLSHGGSAVST